MNEDQCWMKNELGPLITEEWTMKNVQGVMINEERTMYKDQCSFMNERWRMNKINNQGRMNDLEWTRINDH